MASEAQITANRMNAQASSGPITAAGRSRVSRNAISSGLYSSGDFVRPEEQDLYTEFCAGFQTDLTPKGAVEQTLSAEIIHSAWRLRRCSVIEAGMIPIGDDALDPILENTQDKTQQAVDRARANAHRVFHRSMAELRRIQSERQPRRRENPAITRQSQSSAVHAVPVPSGVPEIDRGIPRNAPCTCGSGVKFKRCCGKGAPAVLNRAA